MGQHGFTPDVIMAIDPGPLTSGAVLLSYTGTVLSWEDKANNDKLLDKIRNIGGVLVVERCIPMGRYKPKVLPTAEWSARFFQRAIDSAVAVRWYTYHKVSRHILSGCVGNESKVSQEVEKRIGTRPFPKKHTHAWSALALGVVVLEELRPGIVWNGGKPC